MPLLIEDGLWPAQVRAIHNLEQSLWEYRPRSLIQMGERRTNPPRTPAHGCAGWTTSEAGMRSAVTGSGKTFTAISFIYRLIKFAGARRVLFLVDRGNLADQPLKDKSAGQPIWSRAARPKGGGTGMGRRQFGKGNHFAQKVTYETTGAKPKDLINELRASPMPRIAVTVDMIATGTDIKAVEVVVFVRAVKSRAFFEQMEGRGVRIMKADDLQSVTPDAKAKDHFVIVDAVRVCEQDKTDSRSMEQKPTVSFEKLPQAVAFGNTEDDLLTSLAGRLARMERRIRAEDDERIRQASGDHGLKDLAHRIVQALDPDAPLPPLPQGEGRGEGHRFTPEQLKWLQMIRDHITANLRIEPDDFEYAPFSQQGGLGRAHQLFGRDLAPIIETLNTALVA
jgi:hypothetical protein